MSHSITEILKSSGLFTSPNQDALKAHPNPQKLTDALYYLHEARILNQENFTVVANHVDTEGMNYILIHLHHAKILTHENFAKVSTHPNPFDLVDSLINLQNAGILTTENKAILFTHPHPERFTHGLFRLQELGLFNPETVSVIATHSTPSDLADAIHHLRKNSMLTLELQEMIAKHQYPGELATAITHLHGCGILTQTNQTFIAAHDNPSELANIFSCLKQAELLNSENCSLVAAHTGPFSLKNGLARLQEFEILDQSNFDILIAHPEPNELAYALTYLQESALLTPDNRNKLGMHPNLDSLVDLLNYLQRARLLNQINFELIITIANSFNLSQVLNHLLDAGILNQGNFSSLIAHNHAALLTEDAYRHIWAEIPRHQLTQPNYQRLILAAEHTEPLAELTRVANHIIWIMPEPVLAGAGAAQAMFNPAQSTHTASVHRTVSLSAAKLLARYGHDLNIDACIQQFIEALHGLDDSPKHQAAKRCLTRISADGYLFVDTSEVSIRQLLALAYIAIQDKTRCSASFEDAKDLLIEGLYEIQRGYNLSETGDDGKADAPICMAGTFNKLVEKLNGIHEDVDVYFITHEGAMHKFPKLVQHHALEYLNTLASPTRVEDYERINALLMTLESAGNLESIWEQISKKVTDELWAEFAEAYSHHLDNPLYQALVAHGGAVGLPDLKMIKTKLLTSEGYHLYSASKSVLASSGIYRPPHEEDDDDNSPKNKRLKT